MVSNMKGQCSVCREEVELRSEGDQWKKAPCSCDKKGLKPVVNLGPSTKTFSNAKPTDCVGGHRHASKMEARVCERLARELEPGDHLIQQIRLPILNLYNDHGKVPYMTIDFAIIAIDVMTGWHIKRLIDAKAQGRVSRDWPARKRALELSWGITVEETDR